MDIADDTAAGQGEDKTEAVRDLIDKMHDPVPLKKRRGDYTVDLAKVMLQLERHKK
jgi:hypothetical protein